MRKRKRDPLWLLAGCLGFVAAILGAVLLWAYQGDAPGGLPAESTEETMEPNPWRTEAFSMENGFLHYADGDYLTGIDVSTHQGVIDWEAVADSGVEFAILRAGYRGSTAGKLYEDEQFRENLAGARAAGLKIGVYFFSQALNAAEAKEEAAYVCKLIEGETLALPVFFDWELTEGESRVKSLQDIPMTDCAVAFCREVERKGFDAGVYFNQSYGYGYLDLRRLTGYTLWLAEYGDTPSFRYRFDCLQYADDGAVAGIEGDVDLDLWLKPIS